jgi:hypothetical protein
MGTAANILKWLPTDASYTVAYKMCSVITAYEVDLKHHSDIEYLQIP